MSGLTGSRLGSWLPDVLFGAAVAAVVLDRSGVGAGLGGLGVGAALLLNLDALRDARTRHQGLERVVFVGFMLWVFAAGSLVVGALLTERALVSTAAGVVATLGGLGVALGTATLGVMYGEYALGALLSGIGIGGVVLGWSFLGGPSVALPVGVAVEVGCGLAVTALIRRRTADRSGGPAGHA